MDECEPGTMEERVTRNRCLCDTDRNRPDIRAANRRFGEALMARVLDYTQQRTVPVVVHAMYPGYRRSDITYMLASLNRNMRNRDSDHIRDLKSQQLGILQRRHLFRGSELKARTWRAYSRR